VFRSLRAPATRTAAAAVLAAVFLAAVFLAASCRPSRLRVIPVPPEVNSIEGYGSVRIVQAGESAGPGSPSSWKPGGGERSKSWTPSTGRQPRLSRPKKGPRPPRMKSFEGRLEDVIENSSACARADDVTEPPAGGRARPRVSISKSGRPSGGSAPRRIEFTGITTRGRSPSWPCPSTSRRRSVLASTSGRFASRT
jgi:hypothetical protein